MYHLCVFIVFTVLCFYCASHGIIDWKLSLHGCMTVMFIVHDVPNMQSHCHMNRGHCSSKFEKN